MNWMHSCRRVAALLSQSLDEPLGRLDLLRMRVHLSLCGNCRNVEQQMLEMKALSAELFSSDDLPEGDEARAPATDGPVR
jgi:predicted anti-sigma-YlaC factor YlaD